MEMLTREDVYNKMVDDERPRCPHCGGEMVIWECPPMTFGDGLGWGTPYLYACFNDECSLYVSGWGDIYDQYGVTASYRCICDPTDMKMDCMPVYGRDGGKGCIVDEEIRAREEARKEMQRQGLAALDGYAASEDVKAILGILLNGDTLAPVAFRAAELMGDIGGLDVVEPMRNAMFQNDTVREQVAVSLNMIHERHFTRECPFCAEIIKKRAVMCKHCGKDLPAQQ
jgi:hypothetical protein